MSFLVWISKAVIRFQTSRALFEELDWYVGESSNEVWERQKGGLQACSSVSESLRITVEHQ